MAFRNLDAKIKPATEIPSKWPVLIMFLSNYPLHVILAFG